MKKYIKPQTKVVLMKPAGFLLDTSIITDQATTFIDSRRSNSWDDEDEAEEEDTGGWFK